MFVVRLPENQYLGDDGPVDGIASAKGFKSLPEARKAAPKDAKGVSETDGKVATFHYPLQETK